VSASPGEVEAVRTGADSERVLFARWAWVVLAVVILVTAAVRLRLLDIPLERDEGEYAYVGRLILQGVPPYLHAYNMKLPGIYAAYAAIMAVLGQSAAGIHLGLIAVNLAAASLLFFIARHLFDILAAIAGCASFLILSLCPSVLGISANAEHFILLPALAGILVMLKAADSGGVSGRRLMLFAGGLLLGTAFVVKQQGVFFLFFGAFALIAERFKVRPFAPAECAKDAAVFLVGSAVPYGSVCALLWAKGVFKDFWFWTVIYGGSYASQVPLSAGAIALLRAAFSIASSAPLLFVLSAVGMTALLWDEKSRSRRAFVGFFVLFSFLSTCPGLYFREHYFILLLPAAALCAGLAVSAATGFITNVSARPLMRALPLIFFAAASLDAAARGGAILFHMKPTEASRAMYGYNPFPESAEVARHIRSRTSSGDTVAVLGSEPQIFFYAARRSATGFIYMYPLMEPHRHALAMQQQMIREIEEARPAYMVFVNTDVSWLARESSEKLLFEWSSKYCRDHFDLEGVVDIIAPEETKYLWGKDAASYAPRARSFLLVFRRKDNG